MSISQLFKNKAPSPVLIPLPGQQRSKGTLSSFAGFTLLELIVVVAIIAIVVTFALPTFNAFVDRARGARARQELRLLETEINDYQVQYGTLPVDLAAINRGALRDSWGNGYVYSTTPTRQRFGNPLNSDFDLFCMGKDGATPADGAVASGTGMDDYVRGRDGAFLGLGEEW